MDNIKKQTCLRNAFNFSNPLKYHKFDKPSFDILKFKQDIKIASPKLYNLLYNIKKLDEEDLKNHGTTFKHIIYSDVKFSLTGIKMITAGMIVDGYKNIYNNKLKINKELYTTNNKNNFALLSSLAVYDKPFPVKLRKEILNDFNQRPNNIYGENIRFLLIDQGYKEGIDVYDVKYVHIFDNTLSISDEKQVIGRGTRFCGQKGLQFHPTLGWELHVYRYNLLVDEEKYGEKDSFKLMIKECGIDISKIIIATELEKISKFGAVDYELTKPIHTFGKENKKYEVGSKFKIPGIYDSYKMNGGINKNPLGVNKLIKKKKIINYSKNIKKLKLTNKLNFLNMRLYIRNNFSNLKWDNIKFENKCIDNPIKKDKNVEFTKTQEFVSQYFTPESPYKGILFWHSVGTGKTCSAIATASRIFEKQGYTILWVTRHTLKPDIWKNMFGDICSFTIKEKKENGVKIPNTNVKNPLKYLDNNWVMPISYKQFSNLLLGKNKFYNELIKRNGKKDILRKTLLIIDEAHKLYTTDLPAAERPNLSILNKTIKSSYDISGNNSVKVILMTATPYTSEPFDLIKLLNLLKKNDEQLPTELNEFKEEYLNEDYTFTENGIIKFLDNITGYISYLNRENDARQFANPIIHNEYVEMSKSNNKEILNTIANLKKHMDKEKYKEVKTMLKNKKEDMSQETAIDKCLNINDYKNMEKDFKEICEEDKELNPFTNKCVIKCKDGKVRTPDWKKCIRS